MLRRYKLALLPLLFCVAVCAQNNTSAVTRGNYYDFYNSINPPYRVRRVLLENQPLRFDISNNLLEKKGKLFDTIFSKNDSAFLKKQVMQAATFFWAPGAIENTTVLSKPYIEYLYSEPGGRDRFSNDGFCSYSVPVFSSNRTLCIIMCAHYCGNLCSQGDVYYYKKINGKWKVIYHYSLWIN